MKHDVSMDWGPRLAERGVEFRLWAPSVDALDLLIDGRDGPEVYPMNPAGDGWWRLTVERAGPGTRYRFRLPDGVTVPDPASRWQPEDVHGASEVLDPAAYAWRADGWSGRPWHEAVVYELHVGTFTPEGTYRAVIDKLDTLVDLGVTAVELMPIADFPGSRNWGYDGVLPFAPDGAYGTPDDLRALVDAAHERGLMVLLDVVYNHFGPEGNYLGSYAKPFFSNRLLTPWGDAVNFDTGPDTAVTRGFFVENALFWLTDYRFDGLRLDAVHAICDDSDPHILTELAERVRRSVGSERHVHLVLENDDNEARWLQEGRVGGYEAQWNDDFHHALHVTVTGESDSYYGDYADKPVAHLLRTLVEGFAYQGETSPHRGDARGEPSAGLPPTAFVAFLQNHDQVGNRAFGERIHELTTGPALEAATAVLLLSPMPPLLFMGQEWCASQPFPFFCDFSGELARSITEGRLREFGRFEAFRDPAVRERIPDPVQPATFTGAKLDWEALSEPDHERWWRLHQQLLALRRRHLMPLLDGLDKGDASGRLLDERALSVVWRLAGGVRWGLHANLGDHPVALPEAPSGDRIYATPGLGAFGAAPVLPPWSVVITRDGGDGAGDASDG